MPLRRLLLCLMVDVIYNHFSPRIPELCQRRESDLFFDIFVPQPVSFLSPSVPFLPPLFSSLPSAHISCNRFFQRADAKGTNKAFQAATLCEGIAPFFRVSLLSLFVDELTTRLQRERKRPHIVVSTNNDDPFEFHDFPKRTGIYRLSGRRW